VPTEASALRQELGLELIRHTRLIKVLISRTAEFAPSGLDFGAVAVLMGLIRCGAIRQGELADTVMLDPSTTSRYVTQLTRAGLVERRADQEDGRAVRLVATDAGLELGERISAHRRDQLEAMLADWSEQDLADLTRLTRRLNDAIDGLRHRTLVSTDTPTEQES
jgi:DNA-binding MarR family transcriptional regulator